MVKCKVGDRVKLRSWTSMANEYSVDVDGDICIARGSRLPDYFLEEDKAFCGKFVGTICWIGGYAFKVSPSLSYFPKESIDPRYLSGGDDTNV